jgi:glutamine amidotransferase
MAYLKERSLDAVIKNLEQPVLGICLGMQLLCSYSEENNTNCLSVFDERVVSFLPNGADKIPQVGWNTISDYSSNLFKGLPINAYCYFVHGYYAALGPDTIATTNYILPYSAALHKNNFYGVQFHPEKSAAVGEKILQNFLDII